ncbi:MAG: hypothetical protein JWM76_1657 [Pseudonocardiales bacterium]|nr:hypothetical protein [Pseudonocardiales bacterium]
MRAGLADDAGQAAEVDQQIARYASVAAAIEAAPTADAVWSAVEQAGPDLDGPPITHQG